jgi:Tfp pilus assembly protein PilZ
MYNLSEGGIYFESDQTLYAGEKIYVALKNPSASDNDYKDCVQIEIKWRKNLVDSSAQYGYGAQFTDSRNTLFDEIDTTSLEKESLQKNGPKYQKDARENPRSPYRKITFFTTNRHKDKGFITNISRGGAFIVSKYKFTLAQKITLILPGDKTHPDLKLTGSVVRLSPKGAGVKFDRRTGIERRKGGDRRKKSRRTSRKKSS